MSARRRIATYFAVLLFFSHMGDPTGLTRIPLLFMLKDHLHAAPAAVAVFEAITQIPVYCAVLFGLARDLWSPLGHRDRGYFVLAAPVAIACYLWLAYVPLTYLHLVGGILAATMAYQMLDAASTALVAAFAHREAASGRLNALTETVANVVNILSVIAGGWMISHLASRKIFLLAAGFTLPIFVQAFWMPGVMPDAPSDEPQQAPKNLRQLFQNLIPQGRRLWPVAAVLLLYNFSPGWYTPLFYFLTDKVHLSSEAFGLCRAVQYGATLLATTIYGAVCSRLPLSKLLWLSVTINIAPGFLYLLIRGTVGAVLVSAAVGLFTGFVMVALFDMLTRFSPLGLEGSATAIGYSVFGLAGAAGDVIGSIVYARAGFAPCLVIDAVATALILPILPRLPYSTMSTTDHSLPVGA